MFPEAAVPYVLLPPPAITHPREAHSRVVDVRSGDCERELHGQDYVEETSRGSVSPLPSPMSALMRWGVGIVNEKLKEEIADMHAFTQVGSSSGS
jgi:hypothetical protein